MHFAFKHLERPQSALGISLGPLEARTMTILWTCGECTAWQVQKKLFPKAALTTVLTTLVRLHRKGLVTRRKHRRAFIYSAISPEQWGVLAASEFITHFLAVTNGTGELLASSLSKAVSLHRRKPSGATRRYHQ